MKYSKINKFKFFVNKLSKHPTLKNVGYLTIGNVFSQVISLIGVIYIPTLLGPEYYGIYNTVTAYVALFAVFTFSGLTKVIIRETAKDLSKAKKILEATIGIRNMFSLLATLFSIIVVLFINYEYGTKIYIIIYSFSLLLTGTQSSINTIFQSHQQMKILGIMAIIKQLFKVPMAILLLYLDYGILSLIVLHLVLEVFTSIYLFKASKRIITFNIFSRIRFIKEYIYSGGRFSLIQFFNILSGKIDLVMLSFLTTPTNVGIYALAYRLVNTGLVLRDPISKSLFPYYSNKYNTNKPKISELVIHTVLTSIPLLIFLIPAIFFIKPLISIVIGNEFIKSAEIFRVLVFYLIFNFSIIPWGLALQTTANEKYSLYTVSFCAFLNICLNIIFYKYYGIIGVAYSTLIVETLRLSIAVVLVKYKT